MAQYYYAKSTNGFYVDSLHGTNIPADSVPITEEYWQELLEGQSAGKKITANDDGYPILVDYPPPTNEELASAALAKRDSLLQLAAIRIAPLQDAVDLDDATPEDVALLKKWKQYRVALNRIQDQAGFPSEINWPVAPE